MSYYDIASNLFLQVAIIILTCRILVFIGKKYFGQTEVVCEMLAGLALGPSLFGLLFPEIQHWLFPIEPQILADHTKMPNQSMTILFILSQIGIVLYMFITGMEFNSRLIQKYIKFVSIIVILGVIIPFTMGGVFISLINTTGLIVEGISKKVGIIYFGAAISITAFPVLVRIMEEKKILKTRLGTLALASGSLEDAIAWCLVALVLTITKHNLVIIFLMITGTILYIIFILLLGHFLQKKFSKHFHEDLTPTKETVSFILIVLMFCAVAVDKIGLYSAFGAFFAGAVMPKGLFAQHLKERLGYLTTVLLLPIFFTFTGLNTKISLINTPTLWLITGVIILVAISSKLIVCTLAAHIMGINWRESFAYGVLMNTRGLMELVILNIGLQNHIITPTLFTMMVIMTLVTTLMTSPLVSFILRKQQKEP